MKIAVIGGGSTYTPELIEGLAMWELAGGPSRVVLQDIDRERLDVVTRFSGRMAAGLSSKLIVESTTSFEDAVDRAQFVIIQIRVGGQKARHEDIRMGLERNLIGQETTGVGGFAKALRTVPVVVDMARRIRDTNPTAWIINFTNPSGIVTEAVCRLATTRCVGLCNVPKEFQMDVARHMRVEPEQVELDWVGLNHLGWARRVLVEGRDIVPYLVERLGKPGAPKNIPDLDYPKGFLKALQMLPSSYVRYYYAPDEMLQKLVAAPRTRAQEVMEIEEKLLDYYRDEANNSKPLLLSERGGAWYSRVAVEVMTALTRETASRLIVNTLNRGAIEGMQVDACVEIPAQVSAKGVFPIRIGEVEESIFGLMAQVKAYERLTIDAAMDRNRSKALMALLANPLVGGVGKAMEVLEAVKNRGLI